MCKIIFSRSLYKVSARLLFLNWSQKIFHYFTAYFLMSSLVLNIEVPK